MSEQITPDQVQNLFALNCLLVELLLLRLLAVAVAREWFVSSPVDDEPTQERCDARSTGRRRRR